MRRTVMGLLLLFSAGATGSELDLTAGSVVDDDEMLSTRGGQYDVLIDVDSMVSESNQTGEVSNNLAQNVTSGKNVIKDTAFSGASGVVNVVQNSGSNVLIQHSTVINLRVDAPVGGD